ncbi:MAG: GNAT family N-acetyltransferase [Planctomycetaceae bacterium]|nr:GNAT family N-acetyltransferase [Planctomycetaceae bacterium]
MAQSSTSIQTQRLLLRPWHDSDLEPLVAMGNDPRVMEFFPSLMSREDTVAMLGRIRTHHETHGFGYWAVEIPGVTSFAGFIGLAVPRFEAHFTPCVEIGWRLMPEYWGKGLASEGARATLEFGFACLGLSEIVAMTAVTNLRSRRVMERLGMTHNPADDFDHPLISAEHPLQRHVLYRMTKPKP